MKNFFRNKWGKIVLIVLGVLVVLVVGNVIILQTTFWMKFPPALRSTFALAKLEISVKEGRCDSGCMFERQIFRSIIAQDAKTSPAIFSRVKNILFNKKANPKLRAEMVWIYRIILPEGELPPELEELLTQEGVPDIMKQIIIATGGDKSTPETIYRNLKIAADPKEDDMTRGIVLNQLAESKDISIIDSLIEIIMQESRGLIAAKAADAIESIIDEGKRLNQSQVGKLIEILIDEEKYGFSIRDTILRILVDYNIVKVQEAFIKVLDDKCGIIRKNAAEALQKMTGKTYSYKPTLSFEEEMKICPF